MVTTKLYQEVYFIYSSLPKEDYQKGVYEGGRTGTTTRRASFMGKKRQCVGAGFANGSRAGQAIGIETVDDGGTEVTIGT